MRYDREEIHLEHQKLLQRLTTEQLQSTTKSFWNLHKIPRVYCFIYGHGGTGKTFMWKMLCAAIRSQGETVLLVASSGIASLLLPKGKTTHSRFGIPIDINQDSICKGIQRNSELSALLHKT